MRSQDIGFACTSRPGESSNIASIRAMIEPAWNPVVPVVALSTDTEPIDDRATEIDSVPGLALNGVPSQRGGQLSGEHEPRRYDMTQSGINALLTAAEGGNPEAWQELMTLVYDDLKRIAHRQMARIRPEHTLSTTVLVHEAFENLAEQQKLPVRERSDFYAICAAAMRQIIIDHHRKRSAKKRTLDDPQGWRDTEAARSNPEAENALVALGGVLEQLLARDRQLVEAFEMHYFGGLSSEEIATRMQVSRRSAQRLIARSRAWIADALID